MHFAVTVITPDGDFDEALAPFSESLAVEPYVSRTKQQLIDDVKNKRKIALNTQKNLKYLEYLESNYDFSSDDSIFQSIIKNSGPTNLNINGDEISTYNPNSKWDWYSLGGRFEDSLTLLDGSKSNHALVKDVDWTHSDLSDDDLKYYDRFWEVVVNGSSLFESEKLEDYYSYYKPSYFLKKYNNKENYLKRMSFFFTPAILFENNWHDSDVSPESYCKIFDDIISNVILNHSNYFVSVVDCHF